MLKTQKKTCVNCIHGSPIMVNYDILCHFKGVVSNNYRCSKHRYTPITDRTKQKCIECEHFIQPENRTEKDINTGYCKLFTVRYFDGTAKNACSKFSRKSEKTAV